MKTVKTPVISARKRPSQARSTRLVDDILKAAVRVLAAEGAHRFTTARVAEEAGVSVGSLYQYFPNKEAILFRLQADEWQDTRGLLERILADATQPPLGRLRQAVHAFFQTEWLEAELRTALDNAAPLYREAPEADEIWQACTRCVTALMKEICPQASLSDRAFASDMVVTVMSAVGEKVSERARSEAEVNAMATATGAMLCAYVKGMK